MRAKVDLGADLLPHVLEAVAFDEQGRELGRATQRLKLPRPSAEASLVLQDRNADELAAALIWESGLGESPR